MMANDHDVNLPPRMQIFWLICAPLSVALAARIAWEKTVWTWTRGPQMVGFSLWHTHPFFALIGLASVWAMFVWLIAALVFMLTRRKRVSAKELGMLLIAVFVIVAMEMPDTLFAHMR